MRKLTNAVSLPYLILSDAIGVLEMSELRLERAESGNTTRA